MGVLPGLDLEKLADGVLPDTLKIDLPLPPVRLRGQLDRKGTKELSGVLSAAMPVTTVTAFGQISLGRPPAFIVLMGATFPEPGLQIGLGFAVSGIGGVVGVNKAVDRDTLLACIADGTAGELLFPPDPVEAALRVVPRLASLFPTVPGRLVVGPMFRISWGGRMVDLSAAVVAELPDPVRLSVLGILRVMVPDPAAPVIELKATFAGQYDTAEPSAFLMASLTGSRMAGIPLDGDVLVLSRGGDDPLFVLSAGGFHPAFPVPRGVPKLHRLAMDLSPAPWLQLRCEAYFAVTSNTVQFGAKLSLVAEIADCGLRGQFALDVLIHFKPQMAFTASMRGALSVEAFGETLLGIAFELVLEGPTPWHAVGRGRIKLFLFKVSFNFDLSWGDGPPPLPTARVDLGGELVKAFAQPSAWSVLPPSAAERSPVLLSPSANRLLAEGSRVHPHGRLAARQHVLPLGVDIARFGNAAVDPPERWDITVPRLGNQDAEGPVSDSFAPGQFLDLTEDQQLSTDAYAQYRSGVRLAPDLSGPADAAFVGAELGWETRIVQDPVPMRTHFLRMVRSHAHVSAEHVAAAASIRDAHWWRTAGPALRVAAEQPLAAVSSWSMTQLTVAAAPPGGGTGIPNAELRGLLRDRAGVRVVEAWEARLR
ncbi:DUF6603 domain-containing protein [Kitasatospora sp. NPDC089913]|uniref:DUF6603 domain-containing protein n=1 Tax=Kitasatospora sp. NPDC089913 TaxID=3364080 RepID=UPI00382A3310